LNNVFLEQLIHEQSATIATQMTRAARDAESEEDVRHGCNTAIDEFIRQAGLVIQGRHEYGLAAGRIDSRYSGLIIEYKAPKGPDGIGASPQSRGAKRLIQQVSSRFADFEREENVAPEKLLGVGTDGKRLIFVSSRNGELEVDGPHDTSPFGVERILRALVSIGARGKPFTSATLSVDFGSSSLVAQQGVRHLYNSIVGTQNPKAKTFFNQWKVLFGEVCGYDVTARSPKIEKLSLHYGLGRRARAAELLFAVHSYYAVFIKFLAAEVVASFSPLGVSPIRRAASAPTSEALLREMALLESGGIWSQLGVTNFLEGDLFAWYLSGWDDLVSQAIRDLVTAFDQYDPGTLSVDPAESRDLLKQLYQELFPRSVRHDLGEYYTPDWLAEFTLNELGYDGNPDSRLLDPACGSGTFLVLAINRAKLWFTRHRLECGYDETGLVTRILKNIIGFDLNPLAVMASRTNYLLAIRDLLRHAKHVELPVYLCDSLMTPAEYGELFAGSIEIARKLKTAAGDFVIPMEIAANRDLLGRYAELIETSVRLKYDESDFLHRCESEGLPCTEKRLHGALYRKLRDLDSSNQNGIWARIIKNAFAPLFTERVDYLAGNPPWVNLESLPTGYRREVEPLWDRYGLKHTLGGAQIGSSKRDICALFVYAGSHHYLTEAGRMGFVLTQSLYKSKGGGDGFRRFSYDSQLPSTPLTVLQPEVVHDLSDLNVFEGAVNRTSVGVFQKQTRALKYPVDYRVWKPIHGASIPETATIREVHLLTEQFSYSAVPSAPGRLTSPWLTVPEGCVNAIQNVRGVNKYRGYTGVYTGGLNGAYWLEEVGQNRGRSFYQNLGNVGKKHVAIVEPTMLEESLVFDLVRGRDVQRWRAEPSAKILIPFDVEENDWIPPTRLKRVYPRAYEYLLQFKKDLATRKTVIVRQQMDRGLFYAMVAVGSYTFSAWKVVFKRLSNTLQAAVIPANQMPHEKLVLINCETENEAHYVAALLNSSPANLLIRGAAVRVQTIEYTPSDIAALAIARFVPTNEVHAGLAGMSRACHVASLANCFEKVSELEEELDLLAARYWRIGDSELGEIQDGLHEIAGDSKDSADNDVEEMEE
jgi:hypothetical protein